MPPRERVVAGIMSGTSADGIDVALLRLSGDDIVFLDGTEQPFDDDLRGTILACAEPGGGDNHSISRLHFRLAAAYAAALDSLRGETPSIDLIGCHGQTVAHWPNDEVPSTFQAGSGPALAALTGIPVVHDFRAADVALGGQGAPLIPWVDWRLFGRAARERTIGVLNLGGIANISLLPAGCRSAGELLAFDSGPANMVIDGLARELLGEPFDRDGQQAATGRVDAGLLDMLLAHEYFGRPLPRSAGREEFGAPFIAGIRRYGDEHDVTPADLLATATALTAEALARSLATLPERYQPAEVVLGGGGTRNPTLVAAIEERLPGVNLSRHEDHGWPSDLKEALGFALLADAAVRGEPAALPNVTGVAEPLVLGSLAPGRPPTVWPDWIGVR